MSNSFLYNKNNILHSKLKALTLQEITRSNLLIAWNGVKPSNLDRKPAIGRFFQKKNCRESNSSVEIYKDKEFGF